MKGPKRYKLLISKLKHLGYQQELVENLEQDKHVMLPVNTDEQTMLVPTEDEKAAFFLTRLISINPNRDTAMLAMALHLNFSPSYSQASSVGLNPDNHCLYLRASYDLEGLRMDFLGLMLDQHIILVKKLRKMLVDFQKDLATKRTKSFKPEEDILKKAMLNG